MFREWYGAVGFVALSLAGLWIVNFPLCILPAVLVLTFTFTSIYSTRRATGILLIAAAGVIPAYIVIFGIDPDRAILVYSVIIALFFVMEHSRWHRNRDINFFLESITASGEADSEKNACVPMVGILKEMFPRRLVNIFLLDSRDQIFRIMCSFPEGREVPNIPIGGKSIASRAFRSRTPQLVDDVEKDPDYFELSDKTRSEVTVPIATGDECFGVLNLESPRRADFNRRDLQNLTIVAAVMAENLAHLQTKREMDEAMEALKKSRKELALALEDSHQKRAELKDLLGKLRSLFSVNVGLFLNLMSDEFFQKAAVLLRKELNYGSVRLFTVQDGKEGLSLAGFSVRRDHEGRSMPEEIYSEIASKVIQSGRDIFFPVRDKSIRGLDLCEHSEAFLAVPVMYSGNSWGVLIVENVTEAGLSSGDLEVASIAAVHLSLLLINLDSMKKMDLEISRLEGLHSIVQSLPSVSDDNRSICQKVVEEVTRRFGPEKMVIHLLDSSDEEERLLPVASNFIAESEMEDYGKGLMENGGGLALQSLNKQRVINLADVTESSVYYSKGGPVTSSVLEVPLIYGTQKFGVMSIEKTSPFSEDDEKFFRLAGQYLAMFLALNETIKEKEQDALIDHLTGLWNRRYLFMRMKEEDSRLKREDYPVTVMMVDLAEFKYFNDIYGHVKGDEILRTFAREISGVVRNCDVVGRYGGDEFLLILPGARLEFMENVMDKIKEACRNIRISGIPDGIIRADIGACTCPDETTDLMEAVQRADRRMYDMKGARKNVISEDSFEV